jgi:hypothetical protein
LWAETVATETADNAPPSELWSDLNQESEPLKLRAKKYKPPPPKATEQKEEASEEQPAAGSAATPDSDDWWNDEL